MNFRKQMLALAGVALVGISAPAFAGSNQSQFVNPAGSAEIQVELSGTRLVVDRSSTSGMSNFSLRVTGPDGYLAEVFSRRVAPTMRLTDYGTLPDGVYSYEVTAATSVRERQASAPRVGQHGRSGVQQPGFVGTSQHGTFRMLNGQIVIADANASETE